MMPSSKLSNKPKASQAVELAFEAIGTAWRITLPSSDAKALKAQILERIDAFDANYSRFRDDSLVTKMSRVAGEYQLPADAQPLLDLYRDLHDRTNGAMTPLVGQLLSDAGYDVHYSLIAGELHETPAWDDALTYDFPLLTLAQPALLDFGAAGKGYLVDIIAEQLIAAGITEFCVDAGGDIRQHSASDQATAVGLEHPDAPGQAIGVAQLRNRSLCGSASNRRAWGEFHHIMNPVTKASPHHLKAVWVVADTTLLADGLATALYFAPPDPLRQWYDYEYALVFEDGSLEHSRDFPAEFFGT